MEKTMTQDQGYGAQIERRLKIQKVVYTILPVISLSLLALLWIVVSRNSTFPSPQDVYARFIRTFTNPIKDMNVFGHIRDSLIRIIAALAFNWTVGIAFGILIGWNDRARAFFTPIFNAFRAVPPLAWIPLITLWFGTGEMPKVLIVIFGSIGAVVVNAQAGMINVDPLYVDVGKVFGADRRQLLFKIGIPSALDAIFAGIRTSTSAAWMTVLAAEMLGAKSGIGFLITRGMDSIDMPLILMSMVAIGVVGAILGILTQIAEGILCPWTRKKEAY